MDKKQDLELSNKQLDRVIEVSQTVRDFAATLFVERHLSVKECIGVIGAVVGSFLCEFDEQCPNTTRRELRERLNIFIDSLLESYDNEKMISKAK